VCQRLVDSRAIFAAGNIKTIKVWPKRESRHWPPYLQHCAPTTCAIPFPTFCHNYYAYNCRFFVRILSSDIIFTSSDCIVQWPQFQTTCKKVVVAEFNTVTAFTLRALDAPKTNSVALRPQANYTDCATAIFWRNLVPTFADRGVYRGQRGGSRTVVNLSFLDQSRYFSFK
jgi:hypothetical protein